MAVARQVKEKWGGLTIPGGTKTMGVSEQVDGIGGSHARLPYMSKL